MRIGLSQVRIPPYGFFLTRLPVDFILKYCGFNPSMGILLRAIPEVHTLSLPAPETTSIGKCEISVCPLGILSLGQPWVALNRRPAERCEHFLQSQGECGSIFKDP
jgi:hypothetical protein